MTNDDAPDVDDILPLGEDDRELVAELRSVLAKHGALTRIGITLLHSHFDVEDHEILVEKVDRASRRITVQPIPKADTQSENLLPTSFHLTDPTQPVAVQFCWRPPGSRFHES